MANAVFPPYKDAAYSGAANVDLTTLDLKAALIDLGAYTFSADHEFFSEVTGVLSTPQLIDNVTLVNGLLNGDDVTFPAVTVGDTGEALMVFIDTGVAGTSRLVAFIDTGVGGLPVTTNGGDIDTTWNASGIVQF